ncbi:[citrate (pro-3S)-lyase] ligase [Carnobacterium pleistocenium]|uniref:[citrate (pro-3S)-lyase] ligase n=1 Tax=Carnobacterium pleistocenium TaxID=181073 RepID=UPI000553B531|nr:[citrate (pro-3S)-lyase] ligase [Carnobacterium pleistocenium]
MSYQVRQLLIKRNEKDYEKWGNFLIHADIRPEKNVDYTVGLFDGDELIATGSTAKNVLKCIAICKKYTGGGVINQMVSHLINVIFENGESTCYVYTKPESKQSFEYLGFKELARVPDELVFMEKAVFGFQDYLLKLQSQKREGKRIAGIVMNANPFTKGHLYLIEKAAQENDVVHLFVLSENISDFPTPVRIKLVQEGVVHLENVFVQETGNYMVSAATFPSYFLKEKSSVTKIQATLDAIIFKDSIAPMLNIHYRYAGEEPFSVATNLYNEAMREVFADKIKLIILPRKKIEDEVISASRVRRLLVEDNLKAIEKLVPKSTFNYLVSEEGKKIQEKIKKRSDFL